MVVGTTRDSVGTLDLAGDKALVRKSSPDGNLNTVKVEGTWGHLAEVDNVEVDDHARLGFTTSKPVTAVAGSRPR